MTRKIVKQILRQEMVLFIFRYLRPVRPIYFAPNCKYIFIRQPKVGGSSMAMALDIPKGPGHFTSIQAKNIIGNYHWKRLYKFSFIRNPFSKVVSTYNYLRLDNSYFKGVEPISFEQWIYEVYCKDTQSHYHFSRNWFISQSDYLRDQNGDFTLDFIGRFENLAADFEEVLLVLGIDSPLPHLKQTKRVDYRSYYNDKTYEIVKNWYQADLDNFGYNFDNGVSI